MSSLLVVVKSHLFPQFVHLHSQGSPGREASLRLSIAGGRARYPGATYRRDSGSQSRWAGNPSEARRQLFTTLIVTHNRCLLEAPG